MTKGGAAIKSRALERVVAREAEAIEEEDAARRADRERQKQKDERLSMLLAQYRQIAERYAQVREALPRAIVQAAELLEEMPALRERARAADRALRREDERACTPPWPHRAYAVRPHGAEERRLLDRLELAARGAAGQ